MKKNSFVGGTIIATLAIIFTKVLGMLYVIPFYAIIGDRGSALYSYAYNIYVIFLNISSAGIPVAIAKLISEFDTLNMKEAKVRSFNIGVLIVSIMSLVCFLVLMIFAEGIVSLIIGNKTGGNSIADIALVIRIISLSIIIVPLLSVSKGYLQGHKFIAPTSVSQMIEQIVRIIVVVAGSFIAIKLLSSSITIGVAIAVSGAFVGGIFALAYIASKILKNKKLLDLDSKLQKDEISNKKIIKKILTYAIPFIIINVTVNFFNIVDMTFIIRTLSNMGYSGEIAEFVSSAMTTWGYKLNMIVNAIATGLTVSLIPNLVSAYTKKNTIRVNEIFNRALQIVLFVSIPCALGLSFLATPVWNLFYGLSSLGPVIFRMSILTAIFCNVYLISLQTAQALSEYKTVYKGVIIGFSMNAIFDVPFMYICKYIGLPPFYGATFATMLGYIVAITIILRKLLSIDNVSIKDTIMVFGKIVVCNIVMIGLLYILKVLWPYNYSGIPYALLYIGVFTLLGGLIYFFLTMHFKLFDKIIGKDIIDRIVRRFKRKKGDAIDDN